MAKMTKDKAREVRVLFATGKFTKTDLGLKYGVHRKVIYNIVNNINWI